MLFGKPYCNTILILLGFWEICILCKLQYILMPAPVASGLPMKAGLVILVCLWASFTCSHERQRSSAIVALEERPSAKAALEKRFGRNLFPSLYTGRHFRNSLYNGRHLSPLQEFNRSKYSSFSYPQGILLRK